MLGTKYLYIRPAASQWQTLSSWSDNQETFTYVHYL
jgi:hypothetical protein